MTAAPTAEVGALRALFRVFVGPPGGHHYVALRGPAAGAPGGGHSVELRRGLVWSLGERALVLSPSGDAGSALLVEEGGERRTLAPARPIGGVDDFAVEAIAVVAGRLGVAPAEIRPADHIDLGEEGSLAVSAEVLERSHALHSRLTTAAAAVPVAPTPRPFLPAPAPDRATATPAPPVPADPPPPGTKTDAPPERPRAPGRDAGGSAAATPPAASEAGWLTRLVGWLRARLGGR